MIARERCELFPELRRWANAFDARRGKGEAGSDFFSFLPVAQMFIRGTQWLVIHDVYNITNMKVNFKVVK